MKIFKMLLGTFIAAIGILCFNTSVKGYPTFNEVMLIMSLIFLTDGLLLAYLNTTNSSNQNSLKLKKISFITSIIVMLLIICIISGAITMGAENAAAIAGLTALPIIIILIYDGTDLMAENRKKNKKAKYSK